MQNVRLTRLPDSFNRNIETLSEYDEKAAREYLDDDMAKNFGDYDLESQKTFLGFLKDDVENVTFTP